MTCREQAEQLVNDWHHTCFPHVSMLDRMLLIDRVEAFRRDVEGATWEDVRAFVARHCADSYVVMDGQYVKLSDALAAKAGEPCSPENASKSSS